MQKQRIGRGCGTHRQSLSFGQIVARTNQHRAHFGVCERVSVECDFDDAGRSKYNRGRSPSGLFIRSCLVAACLSGLPGVLRLLDITLARHSQHDRFGARTRGEMGIEYRDSPSPGPRPR